MKKLILTLVATAVAFSLSQANIFEINAGLGKGVNLGNWAEAPNWDWGTTIDSTDVQRVAQAGFQTIRMPTRWETRALSVAPYTIRESFFDTVDNMVRWTKQYHLNLVIDMHHHDTMFVQPVARKAQFLAMWGQIARRYQNESDSVLFEILNEPHDSLTATRWNSFLKEALDTIRVSNPTRPVIIGTPEWGGLYAMSKLTLPADPNIILTIHYYEPYSFTHQGAPWANPVPPTGVTWYGTYFEKLDIANDVKSLKQWTAARNVPVFIGEFGAYEAADDSSRHLWTEACARSFENAGFSWSYWELKSVFGVWNPTANAWRDTLLNALMDTSKAILTLNPTEMGENMLTDGDFAKLDTNTWKFVSYDGKATPTLSNGALKIAIDTIGSVPYGIQIKQLIPTLEASAEYALIFDTWSTGNRIINYGIQNQTDWTTYSFNNANLTVDTQTVVMTFTMDVTDTNVAVVFNFGDNTLPVFLDNITLVMITPPTTPIKAGLARTNPLAFQRLANNMVDIQSPTSGLNQITFRTVNGRQLGQMDKMLISGHNVVSMPAYSGVMIVELRSMNGKVMRSIIQ